MRYSLQTSQRPWDQTDFLLSSCTSFLLSSSAFLQRGWRLAMPARCTLHTLPFIFPATRQMNCYLSPLKGVLEIKPHVFQDPKSFKVRIFASSLLTPCLFLQPRQLHSRHTQALYLIFLPRFFCFSCFSTSLQLQKALFPEFAVWELLWFRI